MPSSLHSERYDLFRQLLVNKRKEAGLTQAAVADRLSKPQSYVAKYEGGERRVDLIEFLDIAKAVGFDARTILDELAKAT